MPASPNQITISEMLLVLNMKPECQDMWGSFLSAHTYNYGFVESVFSSALNCVHAGAFLNLRAAFDLHIPASFLLEGFLSIPPYGYVTV